MLAPVTTTRDSMLQIALFAVQHALVSADLARITTHLAAVTIPRILTPISFIFPEFALCHPNVTRLSAHDPLGGRRGNRQQSEYRKGNDGATHGDILHKVHPGAVHRGDNDLP